MTKFNRSAFTKELHYMAKTRRDFFKEKFPEEKVPKYSEFLKNENPVDNRIMAYEVSYQLSYESQKEGLKMKQPRTFTIYALQGLQSADEIYERTKTMVLDMKAKGTTNTLPIGTRGYFDDNDKYLNIEVNPRGMEAVENKKVLAKHYEKILNNDFAVDSLDEEVKIENKKGYESTMKLDITHFM